MTDSHARGTRWRPPAPIPRSSLAVGLAILFRRQADLLQNLPDECYRRSVVRVPIGARPVFIVNDPDIARRLFTDDREHYPKSDLMISALAPLLGEGVLISGGERWEHDRAMLAPAFVHMKLAQIFPKMRQAVGDFIGRLDALPEGVQIDVESELSHVTADIMFRALFSRPIDGAIASRVYHSFTRFQRGTPQFDLRVVLASDPERPAPLPDAQLDEAKSLRGLLAALLDERLALADGGGDDFTQSLIEARDAEGRGFSREQMIDQLAVFFLAGHETTASSLAWALFLLSQQPQQVDRLRAEIDTQLGQRDFMFDDVRRLPAVRSVFRETLRLYPPVAFLTRRALRDDQFDGQRVPAGSFIVVSPWLIHRHHAYWPQPDRFVPERFDAGEPEARAGAYLPYGLGPRACTGATIAQLEASLLLSELLRRYDFVMDDPGGVFPISRVTIRPASGLRCRLWRRRPVGH